MNELKLKIRSNDANSVVVAEVGGYAVAEFYYQRGRDNIPHYDAYKLAQDFIISHQTITDKEKP